MPCKRGDVVLVLFPDSNLRTAKRRSALVGQADNLQSGLAQSIIAMITSNMTRAGAPQSRRAVVKFTRRRAGGYLDGLNRDDGQPCHRTRNRNRSHPRRAI